MYENISEKDILLYNWRSILDEYNNGSHRYNNVVITCFPIVTKSCCGQGGSLNSIRLIDLLGLWNTGFTYNDKPIVNLILRNSSTPKIEYIENGEIKSYSDESCYDYRQLVEFVKCDFSCNELLVDIFKG